MLVDLDIPLSEDPAIVMYLDSEIIISPYGDRNRQSMSLSKDISKNQYELTLKTGLSGHERAEVDQNSLKLLLAAFTNDIDGLYKIVYDSMETDDNHGLSQSTWTEFKGYKIKVDLSTKGEVVYLIKNN